MNNLFKKLAFISVCATAANFAQAAGTQTSTINVDAEVVTNCAINGGSLKVTGYDSIVANKTKSLDQTTTFTVACTKDSPVTIALTKNVLKAAKAQGAELKYDLFQDAAYSAPWGTETNARALKGTGVSETETVYIRVPAGQNQPADTYTDVITATVTF